jgi:glucose/arabinose dehydrogenase
VALSRCAAALLLLVLVGCGSGEAAGPENVEVAVGAEQVAVRPTQYCLDGDGQRYSTTPPIIEVSPDSAISLTVPESVAEQGWSVQVFDEKLEEPIGEVDVPEGESVLDEINTSDVVPPAFYLVVVEDKGGDCGEFSGAWPVGFLRAGGDLSGTPSSSAPPAG